VEQKGGDLANEIVFFYDMIDLIPKSNEEAMSKVVLEIDPNLKIAESYELRITESKIQISGADSHGVFYGLQTLKQIALQNQNSGLQGLVVKDAPRFSYRGMHLDVGRHFFDVDYIKTYIDLIASHKMNRFHWHLTEDQGWRIEIKKYPKLTEVAAFRKETIMGRWSSRSTRNPSYDQKPYGGYYTQDEVKEIVQYAADRHIIVIPEIEMPGHALAAISAYPNLGNTGKQYEVATRWGVFPQIYAPKEETFQFLEDVLTEVMALFPSEYIHIGGDEAPKKTVGGK
jgi:hexosaminidase